MEKAVYTRLVNSTAPVSYAASGCSGGSPPCPSSPHGSNDSSPSSHKCRRASQSHRGRRPASAHLKVMHIFGILLSFCLSSFFSSSLLYSFTPLLLFLPLPFSVHPPSPSAYESRERTGRLKKKRHWEVLQDKKKGIRVDGVRRDADDGLTHDGDLHHACP